MKIIGFAQLHNELENGNLHNFVRSMNEVCDFVYVYDQASTDGSREVYEKEKTFSVFYSPINNFVNEIPCKSFLLSKLREDHPDVDWIFWMDGDTILDARLTRTELEHVVDPTVESFAIEHFNLWRSDIYYRIDSEYHSFTSFGAVGVCALWNARRRLTFPKTPGLHLIQSPLEISKAIALPYGMIHRGFATDDSIIRKYLNYAGRGMIGWPLFRLLDERTLEVRKIDETMIPSWFPITDRTPPTEKQRIFTIYRDTAAWRQ